MINDLTIRMTGNKTGKIIIVMKMTITAHGITGVSTTTGNVIPLIIKRAITAIIAGIIIMINRGTMKTMVWGHQAVMVTPDTVETEHTGEMNITEEVIMKGAARRRLMDYIQTSGQMKDIARAITEI
jgi:hypothetical protein